MSEPFAENQVHFWRFFLVDNFWFFGSEPELRIDSWRVSLEDACYGNKRRRIERGT